MRKKALVIGINSYENCSTLGGCLNDAKAIADLLEKNEDGSPNFDVEMPHIRGKAELDRNIEALFKGSGDTALLYFAGHGAVNDKGGHIVAPDCTDCDPGVSMKKIGELMAQSKWKNNIVILDCCHAGKMGDASIIEEVSELRDGMTIMAACCRDEYSMEDGEHGIFTGLLLEGLKGGAADLTGSITPGGLYAYIDKSLGAWDQRPVFKTNVSSFVCLRRVEPPVDIDMLRKIPELFQDSNDKFELDPSYEFTNNPDYAPKVTEPYSDEQNVNTFKILQKLESVGLVTPVDTEHMYFAAMDSGKCELTVLGKYYWKLAKEGRI